MEYTLITSTILLGLIACSAIGLSLFLLRKLTGQSNLMLKMLQLNSSEVKSAATSMNTVHKTVDQILLHNKASLELSRKTTDHHRVLLSSLNRQLVKLETLFDQADSRTLSNQQTAAVQSAVRDHLQKEQREREQRVSRTPRERTYAVRETIEKQAEVNREQETLANSIPQSSQPRQAAPKRVALRNLVGTDVPVPVKTKSRAELLERIFQRTNTDQQKQQTNSDRQNIERLATLREREAITGSQAKERRVVNG